jgi:transcriptional regulator of nitric oxide reductase/ferredoxin
LFKAAAVAAWAFTALLLLAAPCSAVADRDYAAAFPGATAFGPMEGQPPAADAYRGETLVGYVFSTRQVVQSVGYSGKPLDILAGIDLDGRLTGAVIVDHQEPILMIGVAEADLAAFVEQFRGLDVRLPVRVERRGANRPGEVDAVAGASISSVVFNDAILRAARAVAGSRGILSGGESTLDFDTYEPAAWSQLMSEGSLVYLQVTVDRAAAALEGANTASPEAGGADSSATFIDLYAGLATPARVGRNLLGDRLYNRLMAELSDGDQLLFVAARGAYSFKGTSYVRSGWFDRLQLAQGERTLRFSKDDHTLIETLSARDAPELREIAVFKLRKSAGFVPTEPWRLDLFLDGRRADGSAAVVSFALAYSLPARYLRQPAGADEGAAAPLWHQTWRDRAPEIVILGVALIVLTGILVGQDFVVRRKRLYEGLRVGFLVFTLVWLGWIADAQLSVVNVLTFADALLTGFRWDFFLLEPLMFILWGYVAVAMLFWGRGVFCGWLCPFGALQELVNRVGQRLRVPQWRLPFALHERLWPIKYVIFIATFALFLGEPRLALTGAEVEPFKTAIVLKFVRPLPFVLYAAALLVASLFVSRAYCRYLCPLGAALAIPARLRTFEWLKRRWQCGNPCQQCAISCPVQAIYPTGQISPNECVHCLRCQVKYRDDYLCPPLIERRKRRERRHGAQPAAAGSEAA